MMNNLYFKFFVFCICFFAFPTCFLACQTSFDENNHTYTAWACEDGPIAIRNYIQSSGVSTTTDHNFIESSILLDDDMEYISNYNLFGTYSDGSLIHYFKPKPSYSSFNALTYSYNAQVGVDNNGDAWWSKTYEATKYVDIDFGSNLTTRTLNRIDFSIHINFNSIPDDVKRNIFGGLLVDPVLASGSNGQSYCASTYNYGNERINVSCSFNYDGSNLIVRLLNNNPLEYNYSSNNYSYNAYFDISDYTLVASLDSFNDSSIDNLDTDKSPNGNQFNDYYNVITTQTSFFNSINIDNYNGLTQLVLSPLRLLTQLRTETGSSMRFTIFFDKNIDIPSGWDLFWRKSISRAYFSRTQYGNMTISIYNQWQKFKNFVAIWRYLLWIGISYYGYRVIKMTFRLISPQDTDLEVF